MIHGDWLAAFEVFARELNFTHAAARLHLTQPALHAQVAKLGERVGAPLYTRRGRSLELTAAGVRLLAFAREARERESQLMADLRGEHAPAPVTLAAGEGALLYLLGDALRSFAAHGDAPLRVLTRDRAGTLAALRDGSAHLGVTAVDSVPDGLVAERLVDAPQVLMVPARHRLARAARVGLADLAGERMILPPGDAPHRLALARAIASATRSEAAIEPAVEAGGWSLMLHFVRLGLGLAIVNGICTPPRGTRARVLGELPRVRYVLVRRAGAALSAQAEALRAALLGVAHHSGGAARK
jgi:LysR family transcriptional regulator, low CO2-responsive transcriptional regulator